MHGVLTHSAYPNCQIGLVTVSCVKHETVTHNISKDPLSQKLYAVILVRENTRARTKSHDDHV